MSTSSHPSRARLAVALAAAAAASTGGTTASAAPPTTGTRQESDTVAYHPDAVADLELVKISGGVASPKLTVYASHAGLLRVKWSGGGTQGTTWEPVRAGHQQITLKGLPETSHVRLRATLKPDGDFATAGASGSYRLRR